MKFIFFVWTFCLTAFSQEKPLDLRIDKVETDNSQPGQRKFTLHYHIINQSDRPVSFILDTDNIIPINSGGMLYNPYFIIYEKDKVFEAPGILHSLIGIRFKMDPEYKKRMIDSLLRDLPSRTKEELLNQKKQRLLKAVKRLQSKERIDLEAVLVWTKERYINEEHIEYYIEDTTPYFIELKLNLMTKALLGDFNQTQANEILNEPYLTTGWYTSNRMPIDFGE